LLDDRSKTDDKKQWHQKYFVSIFPLLNFSTETNEWVFAFAKFLCISVDKSFDHQNPTRHFVVNGLLQGLHIKGSLKYLEVICCRENSFDEIYQSQFKILGFFDVMTCLLFPPLSDFLNQQGFNVLQTMLQLKGTSFK
jgi:hypothetical protein